jgi:hypothetical protein
VRRARIALRITPVAIEDGAQGMLRNGGFELDAWGWRIPAGGMATVSDAHAASGRRSLRIVDADAARGSNITSARVRVDKGGAFLLRGKAFPVSGNGLGMYVKYYDEEGRSLNPTNERGHIASLGALGGSTKRWQGFSWRFEAPEGTSSLEVWIHSYNAAKVEAYLDDLEVRRVQVDDNPR